jgi:putative membrane protein
MLWCKALHIIFMVTWFCGLFYLPRLYVYHAMSSDPISIERFKIMESKLFFGIMTPGGFLTILLGICLISPAFTVYLRMKWLILKLLFVGITCLYHLYLGKLLFDFKHDRNHHSHVYYRWLNEVPVLFLVAIVILVIVKPWGLV